MTIHFLVTVFAAATIALAQMPSNSTTSGPVDLVRPVPGVPLSAEQVEERASSDATREVTRYSIYRDAAGRLRIESIDAQPNNASLYLLDPTTGAKVMCTVPGRVAYRITGQKLGENGFAYGFRGIGEGLSPAAWTTVTEKLEDRMIEGEKFQGTRVVQAAVEQPELMNRIERWESVDLGITGLAVAVGPYGTHFARLQKLRLGEQDPVLFGIPSDYHIVDVKLPDPGK